MPSFLKPPFGLIDRRQKFCRNLFDWCLGRVEASLKDQNDDAAVNWLLIAARSADAFGCGQLTSARLEKMAITLATRLGAPPVRRSSAKSEPLRWLHVMSIGYPVGGHTRMLRRWIESDDSADEHHLALTFMDKLSLPELREAIERKGGRVTILGGVPLLERARQLRDFAWRQADRVVVHSHTWDVVPTIAFGVADAPPVLLLNHADHTFWVGASVADLVVNLRRSGEELTIRYRGVDRNFLFRIPLPNPRDRLYSAQDRAAMRARLGIPPSALVFLTVGSAHKYTAVGDLDFLSMVQKLLTALPEAYLVAVGPSAADGDWSAAVQALRPRLIPVGVQRPEDGYHAAADIYLEGFPFDSHTALLEAAVAGLPVVPIPACAVPPFSGHHYPLSVVTRPNDVESYLAQAISLANSPEMRRSTAATLHNAVVGLQCGSAWQQRLSELKKAAPDQHAIYDSHPVDQDCDLARFWTAFNMAVYPGADPLQFVLGLVAELKLDTGSALQLILAEYRRWLDAAEAEARTLHASLDAAQQALDRTQNLALERASKVDALQKALDDTQAFAMARANKIDALQKALDDTQALATERADKIDTLQKTLDDIQALAIERADKIDTLQAALDRMKNLATERAKLESELSSEVRARAEIEAKLESELGKEVQARADIQAELERLLNSISWRITKPLRKASRVVRGRLDFASRR